MNNETESLELQSAADLRGDAVLARARTARLIVVHPSVEDDIVALDEHALELGRDRLGGDSSVSRHHLTISWDGSAHVARDAGSKNGSWLDGQPLTEPRTLTDGAVLRAGSAVLVYEAAPGWIVATADDAALLRAVPGRSRHAQRLRATIIEAARDPAPALVLGETGVGKESVARELHRLSDRPGQFVAINVAELSDRLIESQLFGHTKGAFTGADMAQPGLFRTAHKGTLLLDEIGELALDLQAKLLRAIQEREVRPVGASRAVPIDVRIIAATHIDLTEAVEAGRFRRDLWARLSLWELRVPSLAARRADILGWLEILQRRWADERGIRSKPLSADADAVERLLLTPLPSNLRALDRLVHRLDAAEPCLTLELVERWLGLADKPDTQPVEAAPAAPRPPAPPATADELSQALATHGSVKALARHYGKDPRQIYRWLDKHGLRSKD